VAHANASSPGAGAFQVSRGRTLNIVALPVAMLIAPALSSIGLLVKPSPSVATAQNVCGPVVGAEIFDSVQTPLPLVLTVPSEESLGLKTPLPLS
jgi:hypothetical protein